jgi:hypothetical protein
MLDATMLTAIQGEAAAVAQELATASPIAEVGLIFRKSRNAMYADVSAGRLRALRMGLKLFIPRAEIERVLLAARN